MLSASDTCSSYRQFCLRNHVGRFEHFYSSLAIQVAGRTTCELCQGSLSSQIVGACQAGHESVQLLVTGSPCDPFSQLRSKRFADGSVAGHGQFNITMMEVISLYTRYEPLVAIFEQVRGFGMPFSAGGTETPKSRQGLWICEVTACNPCLKRTCFAVQTSRDS